MSHEPHSVQLSTPAYTAASLEFLYKWGCHFMMLNSERGKYPPTQGWNKRPLGQG